MNIFLQIFYAPPETIGTQATEIAAKAKEIAAKDERIRILEAKLSSIEIQEALNVSELVVLPVPMPISIEIPEIAEDSFLELSSSPTPMANGIHNTKRHRHGTSSSDSDHYNFLNDSSSPVPTSIKTARVDSESIITPPTSSLLLKSLCEG